MGYLDFSVDGLKPYVRVSHGQGLLSSLSLSLQSLRDPTAWSTNETFVGEAGTKCTVRLLDAFGSFRRKQCLRSPKVCIAESDCNTK